MFVICFRRVSIALINSVGAMRIIVTARQTLIPLYQQVLQRLLVILSAVSKNPSNPNFDHYLFESISALMRYAPQTDTGMRINLTTDLLFAMHRHSLLLNKHFSLIAL